MKEQILELRAQRKTYDEIVIILGCSKGTISYHCGEGQKEKSRNRLSKNRAGLAGKPLPKVVKSCFTCRKAINRNANTYCSHKCQVKNERNIFIVKWLNEEVSGNNNTATNSLSSYVRTYMLEINNCACSVCGWNKRHPVDNKPLVEIDHINGDSSNSFYSNLRVLCPNCHSETPTFRARNKKSSRVRK
jgi:hypothetical protein